ncbi:MAG: PRC-barrel domain-containing protein [Acidobacteria bacterium]|nr:PRC-barrel domain-containing protein [Acidobacteriota bacterium]
MLHKASYVKGFHLLATDGEIGHVDDFLVDEDWRVRYLVVDTSNWLGGRSVLVSPAAIARVDSPNRKLHLALSRGEIQRSPSVDLADVELIETLPAFLII